MMKLQATPSQIDRIVRFGKGIELVAAFADCALVYDHLLQTPIEYTYTTPD